MRMNNLVSTMLLRGLGLLSHVAPRLGAAMALRVMTTPRRRGGTQVRADRRLTTPAGLSVHCWGRSGPLVICLHGWEGGGHQFQGLARYLKTQGFRVWAVDAAGHGESPGIRATPLDLLHALREVQSLAGESVSVVGHSLGAAIVVLATREGMSFSRRVLMSGPTAFAEVFTRFDKAVGLSTRAREHLVAWLEAGLGRSLDSMNLLIAPPSGSALIVHDSQDKEVPLASSVALAHAWPQAQLWVTQGLGHQRILRSEVVWERVGRYLIDGQADRNEAGAKGAAPQNRSRGTTDVPPLNPRAAAPETESRRGCSASP